MRPYRIISLILVVGLYGVTFGQPKVSFTRFNNAQVGYDLHGLLLAIDARTQLLTVLQSLCNHWTVNTDSSRYLSDINRYFDKFRNHDAVKLLGRIYARGVSEEVPYETVLTLDSMFLWDSTVTAPDPRNLYFDRDTARLFLAELGKFARESDFYRFFQKEIPFYRELLGFQVGKLGEFDEVKTIESFYSGRHDKYIMVLLPLDYSSKGITLQRNSGVDEAYFLCGTPQCDQKEMRSKLEFTCLFWHEFGHTFVNPLTWKYHELVDRYSVFYGPISIVGREGYPSWNNAINEQIVRAGEAFIAGTRFGPDAAERVILQNIHAYFLYTREIYRGLLHYSQNRSTFKTFETYLPTLMSYFDTSTIKTVKSTVIFGPRYFVEDSAAVIYPTNEDAAYQEQILAQVRARFENKLKPKGCVLVADTIALKTDLSRHSLWVVGT